jgi:NitT/TauT family transport system ATP-binding protein
MERARSLIKMVRLEGFENHYPNELSGGMQQRVGIARGFMHDPQLLLMDEPFAALDAMTREHMTDELQSMWMQSGKSVLFITHSIPEAVYLADRVVVLSARPGTVVDVIEVPIPRPRMLETLSSPEFTSICNRLRMFFRAQSEKQENKS